MWSNLRSKCVPIVLAVLAAMTPLATGCTSDASGSPGNTPGPTPGPEAPSLGDSPTGGLSETQLRNMASAMINISDQTIGIWVTGNGKVTADPDLAILTLGVEARRQTISAARSDAAQAMTSIMYSLMKQGVVENDIRTIRFSIQPDYKYDERTRRQILTGYQVSNTVTVKIRDLDSVGDVIDASASAGGDTTRIQGIQFTIENPAALESQAREKAVKDALAKAQQFATLTGVSLGKLVYITEDSTYVRPIPVSRAMSMDAVAGAPTPISSGELDVQVSIKAGFGIH